MSPSNVSSRFTVAVRSVSDVGYTPVNVNSSTGGWFGILGGTHEKDCVLFMSRLKIVSGLPYKIVIELWNTHASSSSQEVLLWKDAARGLKEKPERSQSVPLTLPASYSLSRRKREVRVAGCVAGCVAAHYICHSREPQPMVRSVVQYVLH